MIWPEVTAGACRGGPRTRIDIGSTAPGAACRKFEGRPRAAVRLAAHGPLTRAGDKGLGPGSRSPAWRVTVELGPAAAAGARAGNASDEAGDTDSDKEQLRSRSGSGR